MKHLKPILIAAIVAGVTYLPADWLLPHDHLLLAWKGAGVGLLAIWALFSLMSLDGLWIGGVLALGALGDVLIDRVGLVAGALAFLAGHLLAIGFYLRHRRNPLPRDWAGIAGGRLILIPLMAFLLTDRTTIAPATTFYAMALGGMAAAASASRFPPHRVSLGAMLFAISDLLLFAHMGPLHRSLLPVILVWPLYFAGQLLIATGVVSTLAAEREERRADLSR